MKKRLYKVEVFGISGRSVNDETLRWTIESTSGHDAIVLDIMCICRSMPYANMYPAQCYNFKR